MQSSLIYVRLPIRLEAVVTHVPPLSNTAFGSVLALISSAVGAGVLSFPYALRCTGWAAGLVCIVLIAALECFTLYVLARYAEYTRTKTYTALVHAMLGNWARLLMQSVMVLYPFGSCVAYLIITGDSFQPLLHQAFGVGPWWTARQMVITGIGCACILPLCFRRRLGALKAVSSMCVWGLMIVVAVMVVRSVQTVGGDSYSGEGVTAFNRSIQFLGALPIIFFGFQCHTNVISVFDELTSEPAFFRRTPRGPSTPTATLGRSASGTSEQQQAAGGGGWPLRQASWPPTLESLPRPKTSKLQGMIWVIVAALGIVGIFYSCVGLAGYLAFPANTRSNILLNFSSDDKLMQVARACVGLIQIAAYPVNHFPARLAIRDMLQQATGSTFSESSAFYAVEPLAFFGTTLALALVCKDLGNIFKLVGGTCGSILILAMPGALLLEYALSKRRASLGQQQQPPPPPQQQGRLRMPLLPANEPGGEQGAAQAQPYCLWCSKFFWAGALLIALSAALCALSIVSILHPFDSDSGTGSQ